MEKIITMDTLEENTDNILAAALFMKMMSYQIEGKSTMDLEPAFPESIVESVERAEDLLLSEGIDIPQDKDFQISLCYKLAEYCIAGETSPESFASAVKEQIDDEHFCKELRKAVKKEVA